MFLFSLVSASGVSCKQERENNQSKKNKSFVFQSIKDSLAEFNESGWCGDNVTYTFSNSTGLLYINGTGEMNNVGFPWNSYRSFIKKIIIDYGVTNIGVYAFRYCYNLTELEIPDSIKKIEVNAFCECTGLTNLTIPDSVTDIGDSAFENCTGLKDLIIGNNVNQIFYKAFKNCSGLVELIIPNCVTFIGYEAFAHCSGLTKLIISEQLKKIQRNTFSYCTKLTEVTIPSSVSLLDLEAFSYCVGLTSFTIPADLDVVFLNPFVGCSNLREIIVEEGCLFYRSPGGVLYHTQTHSIVAFPGARSGSYTIEDHTNAIKDEAFMECKYLTEIIMPETIDFIESNAFTSCTGLQSIIYKGLHSPHFHYTSFQDCPKLEIVDVPYNYEGDNFCGIPIRRGPIPPPTSTPAPTPAETPSPSHEPIPTSTPSHDNSKPKFINTTAGKVVVALSIIIFISLIVIIVICIIKKRSHEGYMSGISAPVI